jgi:hypothetical protein
MLELMDEYLSSNDIAPGREAGAFELLLISNKIWLRVAALFWILEPKTRARKKNRKKDVCTIPRSRVL